MNYNDFVEIMTDEDLTLPEIGKMEIDNAKHCQNVIRMLKKEINFDMEQQIKKMEERKIGHILNAIEWSRLAKENQTGFAYMDKKLKAFDERLKNQEGVR